MDDKTSAEFRLLSLMRNLPGIIYRCKNDEDWTMELIDGDCFELTGFPVEALINNARISYAGLIHPEDRYDVWLGVNNAIECRKPFKLFYRIVADGGAEKTVFEQGQGIFDGDKLLAVEGIITDITEIKEKLKEL